MSASDVIGIVQILLTCGALWIAYREFRKWRTELIGTRQIELAIHLGKAAIQVRSAFLSGRNPMGFGGPEYKSNSTDKEKKQQDREYEFNQRLKPIIDAIGRLQEIRWEVEAIFDTNVNAEIDEYIKRYNELFIARLELNFGEDGHRLTEEKYEKSLKTVYGTVDDEFSKSVNDTTERILTFAKKHIKSN